MSIVRIIGLAIGGLAMGIGLGVLSSRPVPAPRQTESGEAISDLVSSTDSSVIAIIDPKSCFECDLIMPQLQAWGRKHPDRFAIILTRKPSEEEQRQMNLLHLPASGVLKRGWLNRVLRREYSPELLLVVEGNEALSEKYNPNGRIPSEIYGSVS